MKTQQGWINLYKPKNISSFKAIDMIKKKLNLPKVGHAGTLDPLAEGILPIAIGKTTKLIPFVNKNSKSYTFTVKWGIQTTTDDAQGEIVNQSNIIPCLKDIIIKIKNFTGSLKQVPPRISAVKIKGQRAYKLARKNKSFNIIPKNVYVNNLSVLSHDTFQTSFKIECGKGFYVRSLARDLALELNTYGHISSLERTKVGKFNKKTSILLDDVLKIGQRHVDFNCVIPSIYMLDDILAYEIDDRNDLNDLSFGRPIKIDEKQFKKNSSKNDKELIFLSHKGDVVSFGKLIGNLFKPNKILI